MAFAMEDNGRWSKVRPITTHRVALIRLKPSQKAGAQHCNAMCSFICIQQLARASRIHGSKSQPDPIILQQFVGKEHDRVRDMLPGPSVTVEGG
ncbi:hypothetical protein HYALB_00013882 [Hymenoscyphus albidus]|uniref:Uncharacterized protein n=1 Tax=Hymenoscyphus albidus TaxID=595503 RepID=A0A9N9QBE8_9HELO|nr:hypothetical protein HYALB_00013882 [Hymenoscyphus albidus]